MDKNIPGSTKFKFFSFHGRISFPLIFLGLFLLASTHAYGAVWYVDGGVTSSGGGTSWGNAFKTIQEAIDNPSTDGGDQIWVVSSAGFTPDHYFVENAIVVDKAVAIYGGFVGNEGLLEQRDWANNPTTVLGSGDGHPCFSITSDAILDGFSVTVGNNYAIDEPAAVGGAIRILGSELQIISPTIRNCTLYGNSAWFGGGVGMKSGEGFGLSLEDGFARGTTACCDAFSNEPLVEGNGGVFDVLDVEVWGFVFGQF